MVKGARKGRPFNLQQLRERVAYIERHTGMDLILVDEADRPISRSRLESFLSGRIPMSRWISNQIGRKYISIWEQENFVTYYIEDWWDVVVEDVTRMVDLFEPGNLDSALETMKEKIDNVGAETILTIKRHGLFGWINYAGRVTDLRKPLEVFYFALMKRSPYDFLAAQTIVMVESVWNPEGKRATKEDLPKLFDMVVEVVEETAGAQTGGVQYVAWVYPLAFRVREDW